MEAVFHLLQSCDYYYSSTEEVWIHPRTAEIVHCGYE